MSFQSKQVRQLIGQVRQKFRPSERMRLSEWAKEHAKLSSESSAKTGDWEAYPYQVGIMDAITDRNIEFVSVMKSARVGWTKIINHTAAYHMHHDPCSIMIVQPTIGDAEGYSKDEIAPMIRDSDVLSPLFHESGRRDSNNTILHKMFPGGQLKIVGADSPRGFRRVSVRVLEFDEIDGYSPTAGDEGDQIKLGIVRTREFWNRKIIAGSTPTLDSTSRIKRRFESGDMQYYFVPCPHCRQLQVLKFENLRWPKGKPDQAHFVCSDQACGKQISHDDKRWMVENGKWIATNLNGQPRHASFHIWTAYSYGPNSTWADIAREWLDSHKNIEERKVFYNTVLGEPYKGEGEAPDWKRLYDRRESYKIGVIPRGGLVLTAGVDVQGDRIEVEIVAWGRRMESWSVKRVVLMGDPSILEGDRSPWPKLDEILNEDHIHENGAKLKISMLAIDTGFLTSTVYQWVSRQGVGRVMGVDGRDNYQMVVGTPKAVEINTKGKAKRRGKSVKLWPVGSSLVKTEIYGWLKQEKPTVESGDEHPYGFCHFPQYDEEYFRQLTAEEIVPRLVRGFRRYQWEKTYARNEALDMRVYARAAAYMVGIDGWDKGDKWTRLEELLGMAATKGETPKAPVIIHRPNITIKLPD